MSGSFLSRGIVLVLAALLAVASSAIADEARPSPRLIQQTPACSDFDFVPAGWTKPAFRVLLPEHITADGQKPLQFVHTKRGQWRTSANELLGAFDVGKSYELIVRAKVHDNDVQIELTFRNLTQETLRNVRMLVCSATNHQPGTPAWSNPMFIPAEMKDDRDLQGRHWYRHVAPGRLFALRPQGWVATHPSPADPDPDKVPKYSFTPSPTADAIACAVESADGRWQFYQAWDKPSRYETPCPGNACMHLQPLVAEQLAPGSSVTLRGEVGLFAGNREELRKMLQSKGFER